jgi:hypothetical protein
MAASMQAPISIPRPALRAIGRNPYQRPCGFRMPLEALGEGAGGLGDLPSRSLLRSHALDERHEFAEGASACARIMRTRRARVFI